MLRPPHRTTRTDTLLPYTALCRSTIHDRETGAGSRRGFSRSSRSFRPVARLRGRGAGEAGLPPDALCGAAKPDVKRHRAQRSEEHTSELQSLMRISHAVFCLKKTHKSAHNQTSTPINYTN